MALNNMLAAYYEGKQISLHRISYQKKDMIVNPQHYRRLPLKQTMEAENILLEQDKVIDFPLKPSDLFGAEETKSKRKRAYEKQIQMSVSPPGGL